MADREKPSAKGRKRLQKGHPPPSAADLFDSLIQGQDKTTHEEEPKSKKAKRASGKPGPRAKSSSTIEQQNSEPSFSSASAGGGNDPVAAAVAAAVGVPWTPLGASVGPANSVPVSSGADDGSRSAGPSPDDSGLSDNDEPCVLISFGSGLAKDDLVSPEQTPRKAPRGRRPKLAETASTGTPPAKQTEDSSRKEVERQTIVSENGQDEDRIQDEVQDTSEKCAEGSNGEAADNGDLAEKDKKDVLVKSKKSSKAPNQDSDNAAVGALGVSKDVEDSIRKEIENLLANNRFRGGSRTTAGGDEENDANGDIAVTLEEDVVLVEAERKKHCRFLIRRQEDQTPPSSRNYRCYKCPYNSTRMNNMIRHYRMC